MFLQRKQKQQQQERHSSSFLLFKIPQEEDAPLPHRPSSSLSSSLIASMVALSTSHNRSSFRRPHLGSYRNATISGVSGGRYHAVGGGGGGGGGATATVEGGSGNRQSGVEGILEGRKNAMTSDDGVLSGSSSNQDMSGDLLPWTQQRLHDEVHALYAEFRPQNMRKVDSVAR
jgi:hypothetical protein